MMRFRTGHRKNSVGFAFKVTAVYSADNNFSIGYQPHSAAKIAQRQFHFLLRIALYKHDRQICISCHSTAQMKSADQIPTQTPMLPHASCRLHTKCVPSNVKFC
jgi:hypothetical protein